MLHPPRPALCCLGDLVRLHEELHALSGPFGVVNVDVVGGVGPVPEPDDPDLWSAEVRIAVTDNASGRSWSPLDEAHRDEE